MLFFGLCMGAYSICGDKSMSNITVYVWNAVVQLMLENFAVS
jgi:hypothetical protein